MKKGITKYLRPYWLSVILAPVLMVIEVLMDLQQPVLMSGIVNYGILNGDMSVILNTSIKMIIVALIGVAGGMGCTYFSSKASQNFGADLRFDLFKKVQSFSFEQTDKFSTGSLVTRLTNDVTQVQNLVMMALRMLIRGPLLCIGGIIMALSISLRYGIILAVVIPLMIGIIVLILAKATPFFLKMQIKLDKLNSVMQENLMGIRVVKAYVQEEYEIERFKNSNDDLTGTSLYVMRLMALFNPLMMIIMNLATIAVIYIGGLQVQAREGLVGDVMAVVTYMTQILMSLMMVSMFFTNISRAKASSDRIKEVLETEPAIIGSSDSKDIKHGKIKFENVSFSYTGYHGDPVLKNINLTIHSGERIAFLGSTGAGKTTLVSLIPRFYDAVEGRVLIDNNDVRDYNIETLRSGIGMVLQETVLFSGTLEENIKWGNESAGEDEIKYAAEIAQADQYIKTFEKGYHTVLGQRGLTLSGGQKQRISIARALLKQPKILILDDSTSALDMGTEKRFQKALRDSNENMTCIIIAQRITSVINADRIVVMDKGEISAIGNHDELLQSSPVYQEIYNSQISGMVF